MTKERVLFIIATLQYGKKYGHVWDVQYNTEKLLLLVFKHRNDNIWLHVVSKRLSLDLTYSCILEVTL